ncbi:MAG: WhiB family transcriptional regulator [bacterium]|nr:WhiB family transcriptional regulator [bacterium]MCY4272032.1 WhiB family transcriptional regulator [bacterium]
MIKGLLEDRQHPANDWRGQAACRDTDPDLFFPIGSTGLALEQIESAKAVCRSCVSQPDCLEFALATNQDSGVWGGASEEERRQMRRLRATEQRKRSTVLA